MRQETAGVCQGRGQLKFQSLAQEERETVERSHTEMDSINLWLYNEPPATMWTTDQRGMREHEEASWEATEVFRKDSGLEQGVVAR